MENVKITGLEIVRNPKPSTKGHIIIANFSAEIGVFFFKGCCLVRTARQGIAAWLPRFDDARNASYRSVTLNDDPTRHALLKAARAMYQTMGGTEAEWRSRDDEDAELHPYRGSDENGWPTHPLHPNYAPNEADEGENREGLSTFLGIKGDD